MKIPGKLPVDLKLKTPPYAILHGPPLAIQISRCAHIPLFSPLYYLSVLRFCQAERRLDGTLTVQIHKKVFPGGPRMRTNYGPRNALYRFHRLYLLDMFNWARTPETYEFWNEMNSFARLPPRDKRELSVLLSRFAPGREDDILEELDAFMSLLKKLELT